MKKHIQSIKIAISENKTLVWNDPDFLDGNDYTISYIEPISEDFDDDTPILIQYNHGYSEAEVFAHEISIVN